MTIFYKRDDSNSVLVPKRSIACHCNMPLSLPSHHCICGGVVWWSHVELPARCAGGGAGRGADARLRELDLTLKDMSGAVRWFDEVQCA